MNTLNNAENHIDELIGKYLAGEASSSEAARVENWAKESEENQKYMSQFSTIFQKAGVIKEWQHFDTDAAWSKVKANLKKPDGQIIRFPSANSGYKFFWRIAASIALLAAAGFFIYKILPGSPINPVEMIAEKTALSDTLPDGSGVFLNKETRVSYIYNPETKTHKVKLKGEAYFNIKHDDSDQFIIDADGLFIRDIGTSFNVKAYPESNTVEVLVEEGEVIFYSEDDPGVHLHAGGKGVYHKDTKSFSIEQPEENVLAYKTKFFVFNDTDLKTVVETLNAVYDKKIILSENLNACSLTVSFREEDINMIAEVIAETLNLELKKSDDSIVLEGKGCAQ